MMVRIASPLIAAALLAGLLLPLPVGAVDVTVESGACAADLSLQRVAEAGVTRIRVLQATNMKRRYVGRMRWQGEVLVVGAEVHMFTCQLTDLIAPVTRTTPFYGRYAHLGGYGGN